MQRHIGGRDLRCGRCVDCDASRLQDEQPSEGRSVWAGCERGVFLGAFPGPDHESTIPLTPDTELSGMDVVMLNKLALAERK